MTTAEMLKAQGRAEGEAKGEAKGRADVLLDQLADKFGPLGTSVERVVYGADVEQLRVWTRRVLIAATLDEVLS